VSKRFEESLSENYQARQQFFLQETENKWKDLLADLNSIRNLFSETVEISNDLSRTADGNEGRFLKAYLYLATKTLNLAESAMHLAKRGLVLAALIIVRTMHYDNLTMRYLSHRRDLMDLWLREQDKTGLADKPSSEFLEKFSENRMAGLLAEQGESVGHNQIHGTISKLVHANPLGVVLVSKYDLLRMNPFDFTEMFIGVVQAIDFHMLELMALFLKELEQLEVGKESLPQQVKQYHDKVIAYKALFEANDQEREKLRHAGCDV